MHTFVKALTYFKPSREGSRALRPPKPSPFILNRETKAKSPSLYLQPFIQADPIPMEFRGLALYRDCRIVLLFKFCFTLSNSTVASCCYVFSETGPAQDYLGKVGEVSKSSVIASPIIVPIRTGMTDL
jgi:hypothetical protein